MTTRWKREILTGSDHRQICRLWELILPFRFLLFTGLYYFLAAAVLWWAYDMSAFIRGGAVEYNSAVQLCREMGLIVTLLAMLAWLIDAQWGKNPAWWRRVWQITCKTALVLFVYMAVVMARRELWHQSQGVNDWSMFFGHLNAQFFAEVGWISFLFVVLPLMSLASGFLSLINVWWSAPRSSKKPGGQCA